MGHYRVAEAIKEKIERNSQNKGIIVDWVSLQRPKEASAIYKAYDTISRHLVAAYNFKYESMEDLHTNQRPGFLLGRIQPLQDLIEKENPDGIIATLAMCSEVVSEYKKVTGSNIPLISCITDITAHSEWINDGTDMYLVGSEEVRRKLCQKGVEYNSIRITGVPVAYKFYREKNNLTIENCNEKRSRENNVLIMGGGFGIMPTDESFYERLNNLPNTKITIVTGTNKKLRERLVGKYSNIKVLGFVKDMTELYSKADYVVTKPGGSTMFEAIATETPILALSPKFCQEKHNADFIVRNGIGGILKGKEDEIIKSLENILINPNLWTMMHENMVNLKNGFDKDLNSIWDVQPKSLKQNCIAEELVWRIA